MTTDRAGTSCHACNQLQMDMSLSSPATLKSVADAAGVHLSTASRALDPARRHLIGPDVLQRVETAARELGYRRDMMAAALRTRRTRLVGLAVPDIANPVFAPIIAGLSAHLADAGYSTIVADVGADRARQKRLTDDLIARRVDGLVLATALLEDGAVAALLQASLPLVLVNRVAAGLAVPAVTSDDRLGMRLAVAHLIALGHSRIAHLAGPQQISTGRQRQEGFFAAMTAAGLDVDATSAVAATDYSVQGGEAAARKLLAAHVRPTALAAANDLLAIGALRVLRAEGLTSPGDMSVTGFNDMPLVDMINPPLTTIRIRGNEIGREAAALLLQRIASPGAAPVQRVILPDLIVRGSTAPPRD
jgi:LacI family transcriptional regulator